MPKATQDTNHIKLITPLGKDALYLTHFSSFEALSQPFQYYIDMHSNGKEVDPEILIGTAITVSLATTKGKERFFNGIVAEVRSLGFKVPESAKGDAIRSFRVALVPACLMMHHRVNCRIFQNLSIKDIVRKLFNEHKVKYSDTKLTKTYPAYEYAVQYQESDWSFISRLLEQEGIFYFFEQSKKEHKLILADGFSAYSASNEKKVTSTAAYVAGAHIGDWISGLNIKPGKYTGRGYNLETPSTLPEGSDSKTHKTRLSAQHEIFEYNGESELNHRAKALASIRLEALQCQAMTRSGSSSCRTFQPAQTFTFLEHDDSAEKGKSYVLTKVEMSVSAVNPVGTDSGSKDSFLCRFTCIPKEVLFRPDISTVKSKIQGVQTAVVTGSKQDKEIHIDDLGRVKVQFHWDREGKKDAKSSCWIRVSQSWAGKGYGTFFLPRVGQEVLVEFINGDPSQPLIIGSVYNREQVPPNDLKNHKTQSGIKTRSSEGSTDANYNELLFEDKKGKELILLHAEKDHHLEVEKDQKDSIGQNRSTSIEKNETLTVNGLRVAKIAENDTLDVGKKLTIKAGDEITLSTGGASITLKSDGSIAIKGKNVSIKGSDVTIDGGSATVKGNSVAIKGSVVKIN